MLQQVAPVLRGDDPEVDRDAVVCDPARARLLELIRLLATALLIGIGRSIAVYFAPEFSVVVPYLIMVAVLLVRPQGLFGVAETRRI